jgi:hypothetical protein
MPRICAVLRYTTTSGLHKFVGPMGFRFNLESLHADVSIPTAHLTVIYREKLYLAGRGLLFRPRQLK